MNVHDLLVIEDATGIVAEEYWAKKGEVDLYLTRKFLPSARAAEPASVGGVDPPAGPLVRAGGGDGRPFGAAGGLEDDEGRRQLPEPRPEAREAARIVGHAPPVIPGTHGHDQFGLRDVNANHGSGLGHEDTSIGRSCHVGPTLRMRAGIPGNCSGSDHGTGNAQATVRSA